MNILPNIDITGIIVSVVLVGIVLLAAYFFKMRSAERTKEGQASDNRGCSIAFYVFFGLILVGLAVAYILYRWHSSGS